MAGADHERDVLEAQAAPNRTPEARCVMRRRRDRESCGKICHVSVRNLAKKDRRDGYATGTLDDGTTVLIDRKAAARLPSRFRITVRGLGPMKHLDLDLDGEQWGALLYD